jgi:hypothetical protein
MYQYLLNKYGVRLTLKEISEVLKVPVGTLYNKRSNNMLPFKTYRNGLRVFCDTSELAKHLESMERINNAAQNN